MRGVPHEQQRCINETSVHVQLQSTALGSRTAWSQGLHSMRNVAGTRRKRPNPIIHEQRGSRLFENPIMSSLSDWRCRPTSHTPIASVWISSHTFPEGFQISCTSGRIDAVENGLKRNATRDLVPFLAVHTYRACRWRPRKIALQTLLPRSSLDLPG